MEQGMCLLSGLSPKRAFLAVHRNRGLLLELTKRQIQVGHKGSLLGALWLLLNPLLLMLLYTFVFGVLLGARYLATGDESGAEFALGIFLGLIIFNLVSEAINKGPTLISGNTNYVKKVVFPLEIIPLAVIGAAVFQVCASLLLLISGMAVLGVPFHLSNLLFPIVLFPLVLFSAGIAWLLAALGVFFRDLGQVTRVVTVALLYGSAVFYSPTLIQDKSPEIWAFLQWNPILIAIELSRRVLLWGMTVDIHSLVYLYAVGVIVFMFGYAVFARLRSAFADVL